ncbi:MAG: hypothetical protein DWQ19_09070 [Crenarchaeota archaeon]|nr:MAG: hypothetical protein DWQ19_09070 [Thermoproteota archaeon]
MNNQNKIDLAVVLFILAFGLWHVSAYLPVFALFQWFVLFIVQTIISSIFSTLLLTIVAVIVLVLGKRYLNRRTNGYNRTS